MPVYRYRAVDAEGALSTGTMDEASARRVTAILEEKGLQVTSVEEVPVTSTHRKTRLSWEEVEFLNSQLLALSKSGLPIAEAFEAIGKEIGSGSLARVMAQVRGALQQGQTLHEALQRHVGAVPPVYIAAVRAGEETGNLPAVLENFAGYATQMVALKARALEAMTYPLVVLVVTFGVITLLLGRIIPYFSDVFSSFGAQLPWITQFWLGVSEIFREQFGVVMFVLCGLIVIGLLLSRSKPGRYALDWLKLHTWGVRDSFTSASMARFCRSMSVLLAGRASMDTSIELSAATCGNSVLDAAAKDAANSVRQGTRLALAFEMTGHYSSLFCWLVDVSEKRGDVQTAMHELAKNYEDAFQRSSRAMISFLAPALLIIMGLIVLSVVFALYAPVFSLSNVLAGS